MDAQVAVVGAGPAGALLAYLLASRGIDTILIERQSDFAREFRGEVLMPSGIRALADCGIDLGTVATARPERFEAFLRGKKFLDIVLESAAVQEIGAFPIAVSQPELLEHLVELGEATGHLEFRRGTAVRGVTTSEQHAELRVRSGDVDRESSLRVPFIVGADGRGSILRKRLEKEVRTRDTPLDVVWFKLPLPEAWIGSPRARFEMGRGELLLSVTSPNQELQVAWVILKGTYGELRKRSSEQWAAAMAHAADPELAAHLRAHGEALRSPFLLNAVTDRVVGWAGPRHLLIGDAAHTMSPVGAQGVNLALRDAIVAANQLVPAFLEARDPSPPAARVEFLRGPEIDRVQQVAAIPPRVIMGRTIFHAGVRRSFASAAGLLRIDAIASRAARNPVLSLLQNGLTEVKLEV